MGRQHLKQKGHRSGASHRARQVGSSELENRDVGRPAVAPDMQDEAGARSSPPRHDPSQEGGEQKRSREASRFVWPMACTVLHKCGTLPGPAQACYQRRSSLSHLAMWAPSTSASHPHANNARDISSQQPAMKQQCLLPAGRRRRTTQAAADAYGDVLFETFV